MMKKPSLFFSKGFTLAEILVIAFLFLLVVRAVYSGYLLSYRSYRAGERSAEAVQNGRVILERISREVRQARKIIGEFPDQEINATDSIAFEDGHISDSYHYIHYFKTDTEIIREVLAYYFSGDENTLVPHNAAPPAGQTRETIILESQKTIGEYVKDLNFWGSKTINIKMILEKEDKIFKLKTKIFGRNL